MIQHPQYLLILLASATCSLQTLVHAEVYRCTAESGTVIFSETPCKGSDATILNIDTGEKPNKTTKKNSDKVCKEVQYMAEALFPHIKGKRYATEVINKFGGVHALTSPTSNLINFISFYRYHETLNVKQMGVIAFERCKSGSLGKLTLKDIPDWRALGYTSLSNSGHPDAGKDNGSSTKPNNHSKLCAEYSQVLKLISTMIKESHDKNEISNLKSDRAYIEHIRRENCDLKNN